MRIDLLKIYDDLMNDFITRTHRKKMREQDLIFIRDFLEDTAKLNADERQLLINRLYLDQPSKPKHWAYIQEFIQFINSRAHRIENPENIHRRGRA